MRKVLHHTKRFFVFMAGLVVFILGIILSLPGVPGPGFVLILAALAIWATEFAWAAVHKDKFEAWIRRFIDKSTKPSTAKKSKKT